MTVYKWSQVADNNATADSTINFVEGQAPGSLNNSSRGMMAAIAKMLADMSGRLVAGGTGSAYAFTSNQGFDSLAHMDGAMFSFKVTVSNGSPVTLNVDGLGAKALRVSPGVELPASTLVIGVPYGVTYSNADGAFYFQDGALAVAGTLGPSLVPIGASVQWWTDTLPNANWLWCNGASVSQAAYPALAIAFGVAVGGTIVLPDMRDSVGMGKTGIGGIGNRGLTTFTGNNTLRTLTGAQQVGVPLPSHAHSVQILDVGHTHTYTDNYVTGGTGGLSNGGQFYNLTTVQPTPSTGGASPGSNPAGYPVNSSGMVIFDGSASFNVTAAAGSASPTMNVFQPTMVCNYIIRAI